MDEMDLRETQNALLLLTKIVSHSVQLATHCAMALEDAGQLSAGHALPIARSLKSIAELLEDHDDLEPSDLAQALHAVATVLEREHRNTPPPSQP